MRNEIGKWFMDVAKYVATAVLISSFLGSFDDKKTVYIVGVSIVLFGFILGAIFIRKDDTKQKNNKQKK